MIKLREVALGEQGIEYVKSCLEQGRGLCELARIEIFSGGVTFAPIPDQTTDVRAKNFAMGGLLSQLDTKEWLLDHIANADFKEQPHSIVIQDIWAKPEDRVVLRPKIRRMLSNNSDVYYILNVNDISKESVKNIFEVIESFQFVAVLTRWAEDVRSNRQRYH